MKKKLLTGLGVIAAIGASMEVYNRIAQAKVKTLENTLGGEGNYHDTVFGKMFYVKKGVGKSLLLIHDTTIGSSSFAWRKNFDELAKNHTVYAIDLPGFGKSEKRPLTYTADVYTYVIKNFVDEVINGDCSCIASSLSAAYTIQVQHEDPTTFDRIVAVSPSGIFNMSEEPDTLSKIATTAFKIPVVGTFAYNVLASKGTLECHMKNNVYHNKDLASSYVLNHYQNSSKQDGTLSKYAPTSYVSGYMNISIAQAVASLEIPLLIVWGVESKVNPVDNLKSFIDINPGVNYHVFENCGEYPQEEYSFDFNTLVENFISR
ncbi:MAG: alpha/beta fold hydrolase [Clostridium sp.]